jgi:FlaG/FlaF family flagellin (archaellin)
MKLIHHCTLQFLKRENMHYQKRRTRENNGEDAVSPVVGVMLMLVVTIIIAAVVSGFAGGLMGGNNQKTPVLTMDVKITQTGNIATSGFYATVLGISQPTSTSNLKLVTSWRSLNATYGNYTVGGAVSVAGSTSTPFGYGPGVLGTSSLSSPTLQQYFGNYTLTEGTGLIADASNAPYVLGPNWNVLNVGDTVNVQIIDVPTGQTIFQKLIVVTEG